VRKTRAGSDAGSSARHRGERVRLETPSAATACNVPVTRSCTRIEARLAPTVSDTSVRIVAAVSSSVTARPRISLIV
jgi:hypothetical protein